MAIAAGEIDGVPAYWWRDPGGAPADGPYSAGLVFRTGAADETLATRGVTHLLEHLVLYPLFTGAGTHVNGETGPLFTTFVTRGDADKVTGFFQTVCATLRDLPVSRVEKEKQVLRAEEAGNDRSMTALLWRHRYGAQGYGLLSFPELGLDRVSAGVLEAWAARGFTRGNAAFWLTGGEPPAGLGLDLTRGERVPVPDLSAVRPGPGYFNAAVSGPGLCAVVERSDAAQAYQSVLADRLISELRYDQALTYSPSAQYQVRDGQHAHLLVSADGTSESVSVLTAEFLRLLTRLRDQPVDAEEVRRAVDRMSRPWENPAATGIQALVRRAAENTLLGRADVTPAERRRLLAAVEPGDVRRVAEEVLASGTVVLPRKQRPFIAGLPRASWFTESPVDGREKAHVDAPFETDQLVLGAEGVRVRSENHTRTVRFGTCAALLMLPDGARSLIGRDAVEIPVEPAMWRLKHDDIARIDEAVPRDRHVRVPSRAPGKIPAPGTRVWLRAAGRLVDNVVLAIGVTLAVLVGVPLIIGQFSREAGFIAVVCLAVPLLAGVGVRKTLRVLVWRAAARRIARAGRGR